MADNGRRTRGVARECRWVNRAEAFEHFAVHDGPTQSQQHIKPLHWYVTCRLVLEGGFHPDEIKPRPPFIVTRRRGERLIHFDPAAATGGEATVLGGLKTKNVDVVVNKDGIGPILAGLDGPKPVARKSRSAPATSEATTEGIMGAGDALFLALEPRDDAEDVFGQTMHGRGRISFGISFFYTTGKCSVSPSGRVSIIAPDHLRVVENLSLLVAVTRTRFTELSLAFMSI